MGAAEQFAQLELRVQLTRARIRLHFHIVRDSRAALDCTLSQLWLCAEFPISSQKSSRHSRVRYVYRSASLLSTI